MDHVCPRCSTMLETFSRILPDGGSAITEMCVECGGLWLEEPCLVGTFPDLVELVHATAKDAAFSQADCPTCRGPLRAFVLDRIPLDACPSCAGLWVDSDEIGDIEE